MLLKRGIGATSVVSTLMEVTPAPVMMAIVSVLMELTVRVRFTMTFWSEIASEIFFGINLSPKFVNLTRFHTL